MTNEEKHTLLGDIDEHILTCDGLDDALVGYVQIFNKTIALYDREKCIEVLMERDGGSREEIEQHFEFNTLGAFVGDHTPGFATFFEDAVDGDLAGLPEDEGGSGGIPDPEPE
jgi:hypothetical protein